MNQELDKLKLSIYFLWCCVGSQERTQVMPLLVCRCVYASLLTWWWCPPKSICGVPRRLWESIHLSGGGGGGWEWRHEEMDQGRWRCFEYWALHVPCIYLLSAVPLPCGCKWKSCVFTQHYLEAGYRSCCLGTAKGLSTEGRCTFSLPHHCRPLLSVVLSGPLLGSF